MPAGGSIEEPIVGGIASSTDREVGLAEQAVGVLAGYDQSSLSVSSFSTGNLRGKSGVLAGGSIEVPVAARVTSSAD